MVFKKIIISLLVGCCFVLSPVQTQQKDVQEQVLEQVQKVIQTVSDDDMQTVVDAVNQELPELSKEEANHNHVKIITWALSGLLAVGSIAWLSLKVCWEGKSLREIFLVSRAASEVTRTEVDLKLGKFDDDYQKSKKE